MLLQLTNTLLAIHSSRLVLQGRFFSLFQVAKLLYPAQKEPLPSCPEMKADSWTLATSSDNSITRKLLGLTKRLLENGQPPIVVDNVFQKRFRAGTIYDPFDFSMSRVAMEKQWEKASMDAYRKYQGGANDIFVKTGIDPLDLYTMPEILSRFISTTGQVLPREVTGCNSKNQRKLGIAVKRAVALGLLSATNRHARFMPRRIL